MPDGSNRPRALLRRAVMLLSVTLVSSVALAPAAASATD